MLGMPNWSMSSHVFLGLTIPEVNGLTNPYYNNYYSSGQLLTPEIAMNFAVSLYRG
jgi:hypothetical protein